MIKQLTRILTISTLLTSAAHAEELQYIFYISHHSADSLNYDGKLTDVTAHIQCGDWKKSLAIDNFLIQEFENDNVAIIPIKPEETCELNISKFAFENATYLAKDEPFQIQLNISNPIYIHKNATRKILKHENPLQSHNMILEAETVGTNILSPEILITYE
ncbi:hypothetical protein [Silvanigrella aquatica]|uniref:Uncharacterized protein n=1 Tax=Silvanigrella aquatica TaxID=1915309 RepID=A0A1L4D0F6_9BACT|nr:hypothetical protein [Silvanigrella aquatica]APJ03686.1 hypothetical protein AXG55_07115 [Silvanigrella aquatica]